MAEITPPDEVNEPATDEAPAELDLGRYRTRGLVVNLVELISVPHALRRVVRTMLCVAIAVCAATGAIFYEAELSGISWLVLSAYALLAGFGLGILLGILRVIARALASLEQLLKITFELTQTAAQDYTDLQSGAKRMPSAGELVEQVYEKVLLPTLEDAVSEAFGFLGRPIVWLYRRSIGVAIRVVLRKLSRFALPEERTSAIREQAGTYVGSLAGYPEYVALRMKQAAEFVHRVSRRLRFLAMLPLYIVFFACLFVAGVPVLIVRIFATATPS